MRPQTQMEWKTDPSYARLVLGRRVFLLRRDILRHAPTISAALRDMSAPDSPNGAGNRGSARPLKLEGGPELFARQLKRGGLASLLLRQTFVGVSARPFHELMVSTKAFRRGVPIVEPMGAMVQWIAPAIYRGFFLSRAISGMTLWKFIKTDDDPIVLKHVLMIARAAIVTMHDKGLFHADLNLHNLMVAVG